MTTLSRRVTDLERTQDGHEHEHLTTFAYHGARQPLAVGDDGRVVFSYRAAIGAITDDGRTDPAESV